MKGRFPTVYSGLGLLVGLALAGCAHRPSARVPQGPAALAPAREEFWEFEGEPGRRIITPHYVIHTTILREPTLSSIAQVMEGAFAQYRRLAPEVPPTDRPMECYFFADRQQWARFTKEHTGEDSLVYLRINRGGYTVRDWYVAYYLGDAGTYSVASHEGFHQYLGRHLRQRIPPFLEEGLACTFEEVTWEGSLPRWDTSVNGGRLEALRQALEAGHLLPLNELIATHAGQVVKRSQEQIAGFYAQCWAFARYMEEGEEGRHRPALQQMLTDAATGQLYLGQPPRGDATLWSPHTAQPMLEHYLGLDLPTIEREYRAFIEDQIRHKATTLNER